MSENNISKKEMNVLEKLFVSEITDDKNFYPPQLKQSQAKPLIEKGYVSEIEIKKDIFSYKCHVLTDYGMFTYCRNCK